ncbi:MAG TPA: methylenetetrahydrofolate reductase C-terminal domain-containing protein [Candidatus Acidoferrales bacterium]|nr:methylenetetrahydrofolate reductase C-terminal domain-containing protein [Candidatus Acidoferrales bacterium]
MQQPNPLREALENGRFCYVVELVASRLTRESRLLEVASHLARVPGVVAGSITSYAGGAIGHDPIRVGTAARARGLTPNIHLTCVNRSVAAAQHALEDLNALGIENVLALTGDYPQSADANAAPPVFDLDSVQLVRMMDELRRGGMSFWIAVAVSPFKYTEADCRYQYLKLEKKFAAGADYAITQLGYDAQKFRELRRYLTERGISKPVLGSVYVLGAKGAEKMSKGEPPGCWVAPELVEKIRAETRATDKGTAFRLERAARMAAVVRGLGYAGAYIGGDHQAEHVRWIIKRSETLAPRWEELAEELRYAPKNGFYLGQRVPKTRAPRGIVPRVLDAMGRVFNVRTDSVLRRTLTGAFGWFDRHPAMARGLERVEYTLKHPIFGCEACGNCVLGQMEYVCPQTCPKHLRNGPCGGTSNGRCEVVDKPCIWVRVYERAAAANELDELKTYIPPADRRLSGTSSWINYFLERDNRPGHEHALVTIEAARTIGNSETQNSKRESREESAREEARRI